MYVKGKGKGLRFIVLYHVIRFTRLYNLPVTLPDILNKPTVTTRFCTQDRHMQVHVR